MNRLRFSALLLPLAVLAAGCAQSTDAPQLQTPTGDGVNTVSFNVPGMT